MMIVPSAATQDIVRVAHVAVQEISYLPRPNMRPERLERPHARLSQHVTKWHKDAIRPVDVQQSSRFDRLDKSIVGNTWEYDSGWFVSADE